MYKHQRSAKYCLALQDNLSTHRDYTCELCGKEFSRKDNMIRHQKNCVLPKDTDQATSSSGVKLQDQISDLMKIITKLVERPIGNTNIDRSTNNNVIMNLQPITDEEIVNHLEHLSIDFIQEGGKGYANFAGSYPFKDRIICTDLSRKKLRYKNSEGDMIEDGGGVKLVQRFFQAIAPRNEELINAEYRALHNEVQKIASAGTAGTSNLTDLLTKASHLQELLVKCQQAAKGEENELTKEFVNHLSKML